MVVAVVLALAAASAAVWLVKHRLQPESGLGGTVFYTAQTANEGGVEIGGSLEVMLKVAGLAHQSVKLVRIDGDGAVTSSLVDMTPRLDDKADGEPLKVRQRADDAIERTIGRIQATLNGSSSKYAGQTLFNGLSRIQVDTSKPVFIYSSGLDTSNPVDFRKLAFDVSPKMLADDLRSAGELPSMPRAAVTFVITPSSGQQQALRRPQMVYREAVWDTLLRAAGAASVHFEYPDGLPSQSTKVAPVVPVPPPIGTPVPVRSSAPGEKTCTLSAGTYFEADKAVLLNRQATLAALKPCVAKIRPTTRVTVEGHTSSVAKKSNNPVAVALSTQRAQVVAGVLEQLGVSRNQLTVKGYGNANQPFPDPSDPRNRSVVVRFKSAS
ncbi:OmpA family protein [Kribbella qitaiheensis]|uniref:OmpA family protein n=1 Tax=Kribbella qitaiheensis TaxID=1544730 RepID=UPI00162A8077|nr:OmpA family protein [Kribbella qitaiheensis]